MPLERLGGAPTGVGGPPVVDVDGDGFYAVTWPQGRPETFDIAADLFDVIVGDLNAGRRAINALGAVAEALATLTSG